MKGKDGAGSSTGTSTPNIEPLHVVKQILQSAQASVKAQATRAVQEKT